MDNNIIHKIWNIVTKNKFVHQTGAYFLINVIQKSFPFLILPIFSRLFSKDEMGYYLLFQTLSQVLLPFFSIGGEMSIMLEFHRLDKKRYASYIYTNFILALGFTVIGIIFSIIFDNQLSNLIKFPDSYLILILLSIFPQFIFNVYKSISRFEENVKEYGYLSVISSIIIFIGGMIIVFTTDLSWKSFVISNLVGNLVLSIYCIRMFFRKGYLKLSFDTGWIKDILMVGIPSGLNSIGAWLGYTANRLILNIVIGTAATASFGIGSVFGMVMTLIQDSINLAYAPLVYKKLHENTTESFKFLRKMAIALYISIICLGILVSLIGYYGLTIVFGETYKSSLGCVIPLVAVGTVNGLYKIHVSYISYSKKVYIIMAITIITGIINVLLSFWWAKYYGIIGAAYSTLIAQILAYLLCLFYSQKLYRTYKLQL